MENIYLFTGIVSLAFLSLVVYTLFRAISYFNNERQKASISGNIERGRLLQYLGEKQSAINEFRTVLYRLESEEGHTDEDKEHYGNIAKEALQELGHK